MMSTSSRLLTYLQNFKRTFEHLIRFYLDNGNLQLTHEECNWVFDNNLAYKVLKNKKIDLFPSYFDIQHESFGSFDEVFVRRLQRQVGAIMNIKSIDSRPFSVLTKLDHESKADVVEYDPEFPAFALPDESHHIDDDQRIMLLKWLEDVDKFELSVFADEFIVGIITMVSLFTQNVIRLKELDILLWTLFACSQRGLVPMRMNIDMSCRINKRAFNIAMIYPKVYTNILNSVDICGLRQRFWVSVFE